MVRISVSGGGEGLGEIEGDGEGETASLGDGEAFIPAFGTESFATSAS